MEQEAAAQLSMSVDELRRWTQQVPKDKSKVFAYSIDWSIVVEHDIIEKKLRPWVKKKVHEHWGAQQPEMLEHIMRMVRSRVHPQSILSELRGFLGEEAESFTRKMWRLLIFDILHVKDASKATEEIENALENCETSIGKDPMSVLEGPQLAAHYLGKGKGQRAGTQAAALDAPAPALAKLKSEPSEAQPTGKDVKTETCLCQERMVKARELEAEVKPRAEELKALVEAKKVSSQISLFQKPTSSTDLGHIEAVNVAGDPVHKQISEALAQRASQMATAVRMSHDKAEPGAFSMFRLDDFIGVLDATRVDFVEKERGKAGDGGRRLISPLSLRKR